MAGRGVQGESVTQGRGRSRTLAGDRASSVALTLADLGQGKRLPPASSHVTWHCLLLVPGDGLSTANLSVQSGQGHQEFTVLSRAED